MILHGFLQGFVGILLEIAKLLLQNHGTHVEIHSFMLLLLLVYSLYCKCETKSSEARTFAHVRWCQAVKFPDEALPVACFVNMQETQMIRLRLIQTVLDRFRITSQYLSKHCRCLSNFLFALFISWSSMFRPGEIIVRQVVNEGSQAGAEATA